eukprot:9094887-Pyramimonas_sp.AAC.1
MRECSGPVWAAADARVADARPPAQPVFWASHERVADARAPSGTSPFDAAGSFFLGVVVVVVVVVDTVDGGVLCQEPRFLLP